MKCDYKTCTCTGFKGNVIKRYVEFVGKDCIRVNLKKKTLLFLFKRNECLYEILITSILLLAMALVFLSWNEFVVPVS